MQKERNKVVSIYGVKAPDSSNGVPEEVRIRAIEEARGILEWHHSLHGNLFIQYVTQEDTRCFVCTDPNDPSHNLLQDFDECS